MPELVLNINQKIPSVEQLAPRPKSHAIAQLAAQVLPAGVNSPVRSFRGYLPFPLVVRSAEGAYLRDADGRRYLDLINSWGAVIHGHRHPAIYDAVVRQMDMGWGYGALCEPEAQFANLICEITGCEKIRFLCSGTEATMTALRIARAATGRKNILKFNGHYHGHSDQLLVQAGSGVLELASQDEGKTAVKQSSSLGVPEEMVRWTHCIPFNDFEALDVYFASQGSQTAAVILEPVAGNMGTVPAELAWMKRLCELCKKYGALLIFDEVMTGLRLSLQGAQPLYGVKPDLVCFGKVIGGGFPVAAVGGRSDLLDQLAPVGRAYQAGTLAGNPIAMVAGQTAVELLLKDDFFKRLESKAQILERPIVEAIRLGKYPVSWQRVGSMMTLYFQPNLPKNLEQMANQDTQAFTGFFRWMFERGVLIPPSPFEAWFLSDAFEEENLEHVGHNVLAFLKHYYG